MTRQLLKSLVLSTLSVCFILSSGLSQSGADPKTLSDKDLRKEASILFGEGNIYQAIPYYEEFIRRNPSELYTALELAELYVTAKNYEKAYQAFNELFRYFPAGQYATGKAPPENVKVLFNLAEMSKRTGRYESAKYFYELFKKDYPPTSKKYEQYYTNLDREIIGCEIADTLPYDSSIFIYRPGAPINLVGDEKAVIPVKENEIMYSSAKSEFTIMPFEERTKVQFYAGKRASEYEPFEDERFKFPFNDAGFDIYNGAYNPDRNRFYFSKCREDEPGVPTCLLYVAEKDEGIWTFPKELPWPVNDGYYSVKDPTVYVDERGNEVVIFASNRDFGFGGYDLWYTVYKARKDEYTEPKNMSKRINTPGNEETPQFDFENGVLYFASNGHPGLGGYDIFKTEGENVKALREVVNIGRPINTGADEYGYVQKLNKANGGYFISNRKEALNNGSQNCCFDIFEFTPNERSAEAKAKKPADKKAPIIKTELQGELVAVSDNNYEGEDIQNEKFNSVPAFIGLYATMNNRITLVEQMESSNNTYSFEITNDKDYKIIAEKEGYLKNSITVTKESIAEEGVTELPPIEMMLISRKPITIKNIYYEYNSAELTAEAKVTIDKTILQILLDNPEIVIEIGAHTDSKGKDDYNLKLSQNRALSVINYLQSKGIQPIRLSARGYGEIQPIAPNTNKDGSDNEEGRAKNRRTEFRILGSTDGQKIIYE